MRTVELSDGRVGLVIARDETGEWPDWAYEAGSEGLAHVGGTDQWRFKSYRMAYLRVVLDALERGANRG